MERRGQTEREWGEREKEREELIFLKVFFLLFPERERARVDVEFGFNHAEREREGATAGCVLSVFFVRGEEFVKVKKNGSSSLSLSVPLRLSVKHAKGFLVFFLLPPALRSKAQARAPLFFSRSMKRMNHSAPIYGLKLSNRWFL